MKKFLFFLAVLLTFNFNASAQKIGGKVKVFSASSSQWRNATLLSIKNGQYFIHFDNYSDVFDKLVKESEIVFIDGDDRPQKIVRDTIYITKARVDTVFRGKDNAVYVQNIKEDTIFKTLHDTVIIQQKVKDTVWVFKRDTVSIFKTKRDTVFIYKRDTISIFKTKRDTVFNVKRDTVVINRTIKDTVINIKKETINTTPVKINPYRLGDLVLAYQDGEWKPAVILTINSDDTYKVKFDGSSDFYNKVVGVGSIKLRNANSSESTNKTAVFRLGDLVQVYQDTEWKPAVILEIKGNDLYKVKYDGLSDFYNNVVGIGSIKSR